MQPKRVQEFSTALVGLPPLEPGFAWKIHGSYSILIVINLYVLSNFNKILTANLEKNYAHLC
jgi:hypothetical protein